MRTCEQEAYVARWSQEAEVWELGRKKRQLSAYWKWVSAVSSCGLLLPGVSKDGVECPGIAKGAGGWRLSINFQPYGWKFHLLTLLPWQLRALGSDSAPFCGCGKSPKAQNRPCKACVLKARTGNMYMELANAVSLKSSGLIACGSETTGVYPYYFCTYYSCN